MINRITWYIRDWIIHFVIEGIVIGGHCGCCGAWVSDCLVPSYWQVTVCKKCVRGAE